MRDRGHPRQQLQPALEKETQALHRSRGQKTKGGSLHGLPVGPC